MKLRAAVCVGGLLAGVAAANEPLDRLRVPQLTLAGTDGKSHRLPEVVAGADFTVLIFFARLCPCVAAHDARVKQLEAELRGKVQLFFVDSEAGSSLEEDVKEARARNYLVPILRDDSGAAARDLGVEFATGTVIFDRAGRARYRGGIDTVARDVKDDTPFPLRDALLALLAGRAPPDAEPKTFGCYLRRN